jgi:hypothetical protein
MGGSLHFLAVCEIMIIALVFFPLNNGVELQLTKLLGDNTEARVSPRVPG